jgi:receptor-type tyrosine-protein phosphatase F
VLLNLFFFSLRANQMGYTDRREVKQFQFTAWPDHGVPEHPAPFLQFIRRIHMLNPGDSGPIVTHCRSAIFPVIPE